MRDFVAANEDTRSSHNSTPWHESKTQATQPAVPSGCITTLKTNKQPSCGESQAGARTEYPQTTDMGNETLQTLQDEALSKIGVVPSLNSNNSLPGAFACTVPLNSNGGDASAELLHVKKEVQLSSSMEAELLQKQGIATVAGTSNSIVNSLQEALLRKHASVNSQLPATEEEQIMDGDLDLEVGRVRNDLDAFEASIDGKAYELVSQSEQQQQQPSGQDLLDEDILDTLSVSSEEETDEDSDDKPPATQEEDISDTHDETLGDSTNVEAELAPDFEGLEREHNILVQRIREITSREVVEAEVIPGKRRARMIGTVVVVFTLIIVVTLSVLLTKNNDNTEVVVVEGVCTESSPLIDVDTTTERFEAMLAIFDPVYGAESFADQSPENPRFRALHWIANEDPQMISLESSKLQYIQQRYIMVLLYFSTQGWCWTNKLNWLGSFDVCRWEHVLCSSGLVEKIGIPTNNLVGTLISELGQLSNSLDRLDLCQYSGCLFCGVTSLFSNHDLTQKAGSHLLIGYSGVDAYTLQPITISLGLSQLNLAD